MCALVLSARRILLNDAIGLRPALYAWHMFELIVNMMGWMMRACTNQRMLLALSLIVEHVHINICLYIMQQQQHQQERVHHVFTFEYYMWCVSSSKRKRRVVVDAQQLGISV